MSKHMETGKVDAETAERSLDEFIQGLAGFVQYAVFEDVLDLNCWVKKLVKNPEGRYFIGKAYRQWKYGEKLTNPLVTFSKELKMGKYELMSDEDIDELHDVAKDLSVFWRSEAELTADVLKGNIGFCIIQKVIVKALGDLKAGSIDLQKALESLSWEYDQD